MRVFIVDTYYPAFLKTHYNRSPDLESQPYNVQWRALMDTFFGTADAYSHNLTAIGYDAHEFVVNCAPLQSAWASEHGVRVNSDRAEEAILLAQARDYEPDVVYVQHVHYLSDTTLAALKGMSRLLVGQIATEPPDLARMQSSTLSSRACHRSSHVSTPTGSGRNCCGSHSMSVSSMSFEARSESERSAKPSSSAHSVEPSIGGRTESSPGSAPSANRVLGLRRPALASVVPGQARLLR